MGAEVSQRIEGGFVFYMEMKNNNTHAVKLFHNSSFHISLTGSGWRNGDKKHNSKYYWLSFYLCGGCGLP